MKNHARELVAEAAQALAGKPHTAEELHYALYQLALDIMSPPASQDPLRATRRMPAANEVLPPHQRATWARKKTMYDVEES